jgi:hypothetical protein
MCSHCHTQRTRRRRAISPPPLPSPTTPPTHFHLTPVSRALDCALTATLTTHPAAPPATSLAHNTTNPFPSHPCEPRPGLCSHCHTHNTTHPLPRRRLLFLRVVCGGVAGRRAERGVRGHALHAAQARRLHRLRLLLQTRAAWPRPVSPTGFNSKATLGLAWITKTVITVIFAF